MHVANSLMCETSQAALPSRSSLVMQKLPSVLSEKPRAPRPRLSSRCYAHMMQRRSWPDVATAQDGTCARAWPWLLGGHHWGSLGLFEQPAGDAVLLVSIS